MTEDILEWLVKNVDSKIVPVDKRNDEALLYNLIHKGDGRVWDYEPDQVQEVQKLYEIHAPHKLRMD